MYLISNCFVSITTDDGLSYTIPLTSCSVNSNMNKISTMGEFTTFRFGKVEERKITRDDTGDNLTITQENKVIDIDIKDIFKRGSEISITIGYSKNRMPDAANNAYDKFFNLSFKEKNINSSMGENVNFNSFDRTYYISLINYNRTEVNVKFEDFMFNLSNPSVSGLRGRSEGTLASFSYGDPKLTNKTQDNTNTVADLIETIKQKLKIEFKKSKLEIRVFPEETKIILESYAIDKLTWGQLLEYLRKTYLINIHFFGKVLYIYLPYTKSSIEKTANDSDSFRYSYLTQKWHRFYYTFFWDTQDTKDNANRRYYQPIIDYNLDYWSSKDYTLTINGKLFKEDGTLEEFSWDGVRETSFKVTDRNIDIPYYGIKFDDMKPLVKDMHTKYHLDGFRGEFDTFMNLENYKSIKFENNDSEGVSGGNIFSDMRERSREVTIGDRVTLLNSYIDYTKTPVITDIGTEDSSQYLVEGTNYSYGPEGLRTKIILGRKII